MTSPPATGSERDARVSILNSILSTPHRKLEEIDPLHAQALDRDPMFYGHLAAWYMLHGEVRDHKVVFISRLLTCPYADYRGAGYVFLQDLAPYEVARLLDHAKQVIKKTPRQLRTAITAYLRTREASVRQFDGAALRMRNDLKHLYASLRLKPSARAQAILFADTPPEDSPLYALKALARETDPLAQATLILDNKIPFPTAIGAISHLTPAVLVALIAQMSPAEVINVQSMLTRRKALDNPEVKALVDAKLRAAQTDKRVSTLKAQKAAQSIGVSAETARSLRDVSDARVAQSTMRITRPTAILVDKSGSMQTAINVATQVAALVSAASEADVRVYVFDNQAMELKRTSPGPAPAPLSEWETLFSKVVPHGGTSIGSGVAKMTRDRVYVQQIVIITDEDENAEPRLGRAYQEYVQSMGVTPSIFVISVEARQNTLWFDHLTAQGIDASRYVFAGDYYALPNILPLLAAPTKADLVDIIMETPLPTRTLGGKSTPVRETATVS